MLRLPIREVTLNSHLTSSMFQNHENATYALVHLLVRNPYESLSKWTSEAHWSTLYVSQSTLSNSSKAHSSSNKNLRNYRIWEFGHGFKIKEWYPCKDLILNKQKSYNRVWNLMQGEISYFSSEALNFKNLKNEWSYNKLARNFLSERNLFLNTIQPI